MLDPIELRNTSHCPLSLCKKAVAYTIEHDGDDLMAIAYLRAKCLAVHTKCSFDERVLMFREAMEANRK